MECINLHEKLKLWIGLPEAHYLRHHHRWHVQTSKFPSSVVHLHDQPWTRTWQVVANSVDGQMEEVRHMRPKNEQPKLAPPCHSLNQENKNRGIDLPLGESSHRGLSEDAVHQVEDARRSSLHT